MKPYRTIPISECGEPLTLIPKGIFAFFDPHPYIALGAPYGEASPWMLRQKVLQGLERAQAELQKRRPGWKIMLFDAYRPHAVQAFMVEREYALLAKAEGLDYAALTPEQREYLTPKVLRIWGIPSEDPATPPPHSTGGVVDCTLADESGKPIDMGGELDENSERSNPDYYINASDETGRRFHAMRQLLYDLMKSQGFHRMRDEWWHFSRDDQYWAWREREEGGNPGAIAIYGRADLL